MATIEAIKEGVWIQGMLRELNIFKGTSTVYSESQSAIHLCKNLVFHDRTKHVEIKYHFIREKITQREIKIEKVATEENTTDVGTKIVTLGSSSIVLNY